MKLAADSSSVRPFAPGVVLDAGLLLLLFVGLVDRRLIQRCKRTRQYQVKHFELLVATLERFGRPMATPHIVAEASNLAGQLYGLPRHEFFANLAEWLQVSGSEIGMESRTICELEPNMIARFGVTDCVTIVAAATHAVMTDDTALAAELRRRSLNVLDFKLIVSELEE